MIKLADTLAPMSEFPAAMAEHIGFSDGATLQEKFDNKELGGGDSSVTLTQEEYEALTEEEKLDGLYYTYDTKRIYKNGVQYGASEPIPLTMEEYTALKEAGAIDEQQEYLIEADAEGILLDAEDIGYSNAVSNLNVTTAQGAIDKINDKVDNLIDDEVSDATVWSSKKTSGEIDALISDTTSSTTSTYSSAKIDEKYGSLTFASEGSTQWLKLKLGTSSKHQPIVVSDQYGGKVEILGMANDGTYKSVKLVRYSYGDWTTHSATDYTTTDVGDANYKIRRFFYYPTDGCYYLEIRQWAIIKVEGNSTAEMVASLPAETSAMTLIPESAFARKKDIDGVTIQTTVTTGSEYYAITFKDKQFERGNNQGVLIQHNRLNFEPLTFIFSASSYNTASYERDNYDVTKVNGGVYNPTSPYMMHFYMDKANNTLYLSIPSYSGVTLTDLQFKSDAVSYTKVNAIPDTATKITVTEYATKEELKTNSNTEPITIAFPNIVEQTSYGNASQYQIRNGICYVTMDIMPNGDSENTVVCELPMSTMMLNISVVPFALEQYNQNGMLILSTNGVVKAYGLEKNVRYAASFSYPIA